MESSRETMRRSRTAGFECSTPYGINGIFTLVTGLLQAGDAVLNALRHQWNLHTLRPCRRRAALTVLNALRHQWNLHPGKAPAPFHAGHVLNALRHQWNLHSRIACSHAARVWCSTPYGINGIFTLREQLRSKACSGAQRLTASMESSQNLRHTERSNMKCSTPYGINGIFTKHDWVAYHISVCAQRLTASMESSHSVG